MTFEQFDGVLSTWAERHGLHVSTRYKDTEVRAVRIVDDAGAEYELWLSLLPPNRLEVAAWDFGKRRSARACEVSGLPDALESVYAAVAEWIRDNGHTRTPAR